jgi:hypothetical protein
MIPALAVAVLLTVAFAAPARGADPVTEGKAISDLRVRVHGTAAVATYAVAIDGVWMKEPFHVSAIITQTWVKEASGWKLAATHASRREERRPEP